MSEEKKRLTAAIEDKLKPFEGRRLEDITAEEIEERLKDVLPRALMPEWQRRRADLERRKPKPRVGVCRLCGGKVTEEFVTKSSPITDLTPIGGPPLPTWWESEGLHCTDCGICYAKVPPPPEIK